MDTIARGTYGGQVYISVVPVASAISTITPYVYTDGNSKSLNSVNGNAVTTKLQLDHTTKPFNDVPSNVTRDIAQQVVDYYVGTAAAGASDTDKRNLAIDGINYVNKQIYDAALNEYTSSNLDFNVFKGQSGQQWTIADLTGTLFANNLWTIHSPSFPLFTVDAQNHVPDSTTTNISYSFDSVHTGLMGLTGTFGNPAKAVYDPSAVTQLPHVTAPTK